MKNRSIRAAVAVALATAAFGLAACSSDKDSDSGTSTTQAAGKFEEGKNSDPVDGSAKPSTPPPNLAKPSTQLLNDRITKAFDPNVGNEEKISWVQDAERDPELVNKLVDAAKAQNVKVEITGVQEPKDGKLKADAKVTIDGSPVENAFVEFVAVGDQWQVSHQFTCNIVKSAKLDSAACQAK
ncbi:FixH family protein [Nocardia australiensis]|uniref:FixH family protein n=1 Tax=Nocardia australiensis TaxID=2887191 RepID=UPI001D154A77|nr:FixH family protein [Nocardia australiensis]